MFIESNLTKEDKVKLFASMEVNKSDSVIKSEFGDKSNLTKEDIALIKSKLIDEYEPLKDSL